MKTEQAQVIATMVHRAVQDGGCGGNSETTCLSDLSIETPCSACLAWLAVDQWARDCRDAERTGRAVIGGAYVDA